MYHESVTVLRVLAPLLDRANVGIAHLGVEQDKILSIEGQTGFLGRLLTRLKAGRISAKDQGRVRSALQSGYMLKKYRFGGNPVERESAAIRGFIARNSSLADPSTDPWLKANIQTRMASILKKVLPVSVYWKPKFGGGAVAEHVPWLARWERITTYPELHQGHLLPVSLGLSLHGGEAVRLCAVPKDYAKDRLITVEPWLNTFAQHATRRMVYESIHNGPLRGTCMDALHIDSPESVQRALAVEGSKNGLYATLDMRDASDSISLQDVVNVFPPWLIGYLEACRTPRFDAGDCKLRDTLMYAGMGNATTFVVQTLYFWAATMAIAALSGHRKAFVSVHGDDIVSDSLTAALIHETGGFTALGLVVNEAKSFWGECSFRESCGIWALNGLDVSPSRFDGFDLGSFRGRVGFADVIRRMLDSRCGMQLMLADRLVKSCLPCMKVTPWDVPGSELVPDKRELWTRSRCKTETRLNRDLQVHEVKTQVEILRTIRVPADRDGYLYGALLGSVTTNVQRADLRPERFDAAWSRLHDAGMAFLSEGCTLWAVITFLITTVDHLGHFAMRGLVRNHVVTVPLPRGKVKMKMRWVPINGYPVGASSSIRKKVIH